MSRIIELLAELGDKERRHSIVDGRPMTFHEVQGAGRSELILEQERRSRHEGTEDPRPQSEHVEQRHDPHHAIFWTQPQSVGGAPRYR